LYGLLGDLPDRDRPIGVKTLSEEQREGYVLERLELDLNGVAPVPAYFVKPLAGAGSGTVPGAAPRLEGDGAGQSGPEGAGLEQTRLAYPTVLYNHAHGGNYELGKDELIAERGAIQSPYADVLTSRGYAALCIDHWCFGQRCKKGAGGEAYPVVLPGEGHPELETVKRMLWDGRVMWGMMIYDSLRAMDYMVSRPDVDATRIATMGLSMGSTMAWWLAALDERVKVCIDICCLTEMHTFRKQHGPLGHGIYYYVPGLLKHFTTSQINAEMQRTYGDMGAAEAWKLHREDVGHQETPTMREAILVWLERWL